MDDFESRLVTSAVRERLRLSSPPIDEQQVVNDVAQRLNGIDRETVETCVSLLAQEQYPGRANTAFDDIADPVPQSAIDEDSSPGEETGVVTAGRPTDERFGQLRILEDISHEQVPDIAEDAYYERQTAADKTDVQVVTKALEEGMNVVLKGPPGVGKSFLAKYICARTNRPLYRVTLSETTYREDLLGHLQLVSTPGGDSITSWVDGPLTRAARVGGTLLLDEINAADANTAAALNAVMEQEDTRSLTIPQTGEVVDPHSQFRVIATANPGYQGTYELNDAFEGRFKHVELDYLPADIETRIIFERTDLDERKRAEIEDLVAFAGRLREAYVDGELTTPITTRELVRIATFMETGFMDLETATRNELVPRVDKHDEALVETLIEKSL